MRDIFRYTIRLFNRRKLRTFLTILQVALGVWAISLILSTNFNISNQISEATTRYGQNLIEVTAGIEEVSEDGSVQRRTNAVFALNQLDELKESDNIRYAYLIENISIRHGLVQNDKSYRLQGLVGTSADFFRAAELNIIAGDFFTLSDVEQGNRVIVISETLARQLFPELNPLGEIIELTATAGMSGRVQSNRENLEFEVIGVFEDMNELQTVFVELSHGIIPLGSQHVARISQSGGGTSGGSSTGAGGEGSGGGNSAPSPENIRNITENMSEELSRRITTGLQQMGSALTGTYRNIIIEAETDSLYNAAEDFRTIIQPTLDEGEDIFFEYIKDREESLLDSVNQIILFFAGFAFIAIIISGVGVLSLMLISVVERTHETGLRRALGASKRWILMQFLGESVLLSLLGAFLGLILAALSANYVLEDLLFQAFRADLIPFEARLHVIAILISLGITSLTGILAGLLPAREAAKIPPIDALREG